MKVIHWDCLIEMDKLIEQWIKVDSIIADIPYWTTACKRDTIIPFDEMRPRLNKLIKPNGAIVLFWSEPFSSALRMSNIKNYKYDWVWDKLRWSWFNYARFQPMRQHELISVFYNKAPYYNSQWEKLEKPTTYKMAWTPSNSSHMTHSDKNRVTTVTHKKKTSILKFKKVNQNSQHPTQKPVALMEYLIKTYTNEWETVLDFTAGSGSTGIAALNTGRECILIEKEEKYIKIINERLDQTFTSLLD